MKVEQLSIALDSASGCLVDITNLLAGNGINIRTLSLADSGPYGILRLIVNDTEKARQLFLENGFKVHSDVVLVLEVPDKPGGLASVLKTITDVGLSVEYLYAFTQKSGESGLIIFRINADEKAAKALAKAGIRVLSDEEVSTI
ncbi:MAG: ACT domain-containing protein [Proteobacteria bacterium]|nr:ACT domain-containing protein [Pseudomonadota bacterium]MBU1710012.1 ACT domain-containing protein [Pseudomonadota bacterium]